MIFQKKSKDSSLFTGGMKWKDKSTLGSENWAWRSRITSE